MNALAAFPFPMKTRFLLAAVAVVASAFFVSANPALATDPPEPPTVSTSGSAELHVVADLVDLNFEVAVRREDLGAARKMHTDHASKVLAALRAAGIEEKDLQTSQVSIQPTYAENRHGETATVKYYDIGQSFTCTLHDVNKVADVTTQVVNAGATSVRSANLRTSELRKYRDEARAQAARAAKEKAIALATELGAKVGKPYKIVEESGDFRPMTANVSVAPASAEAGTARTDEQPQTVFAPGLLTITANVSVVFYLE